MLTCSKTYSDIPFAHRQHRHDGHCAWIHGHNWSIKLVFVAAHVDENGFVIDFGKLGFIKDWISEFLDHSLLLNDSDPYRPYLQQTLDGFSRIYVVKDASCEGLAQHFFNVFNDLVEEATNGRVRIREVSVIEDSRNEATYREGI